MRKAVLLIIVFIAFIMTSCGNVIIPTDTNGEPSASLSSIALPTDRGEEHTTSEYIAESTSSEPVESTALTLDIAVLPQPIGDYSSIKKQIKFKEIAEYPKGLRNIDDAPYMYQMKTDAKGSAENRDKSKLLILHMVGYKGFEQDGLGVKYAIYYAYAERYGEGIVDNTVYTVKMAGTPESQYFGRYVAEIGERYAVFIRDELDEYKSKNYSIRGIFYKVEEKDGVDWIYPDVTSDFSRLKCSVRVNDANERVFYKKGDDDEILSYLKKVGLDNYYIEYKCELSAFADEMCTGVNVDFFNNDNKSVNKSKIIPVGEYSSIKEEVPFENFAAPANIEDVKLSDFIELGYKNEYTMVIIAGYKGEQTDEDGTVYSYYYVYAASADWMFCDDAVYIMKAYGSPAHPYYGQRRYEIGDILLRLDKNNDYVRTGVMEATRLFYMEKHVYFYDYYMDFCIDSTSFPYMKEVDEKNWRGNLRYVYDPTTDADVYEYMEKNNIEIPVYDYYNEALPDILCDNFNKRSGNN